MLGRKLTGSASFVCLRCRLQLAGAPNRIPFPALTSTASLRNPRRYQWTQANFFGEDEPKDRLADDKNAESRFSNEPNWDDDADLWANSRNDDMGASRSPPPPRPLRHPRNRTYKTRGHFVSPEHEGLSIDILGKPGGAIVLRETRAIEKRARPPALVLDADNGPIDPASLLAAAIVGSASEDILLNIHELKPETLILTEKEFNKLKGTLVKGFTSAQLGLYLREHQQAGRFVQEEAETVDEHPWILERHPWAPIFANVTQEVDSHLVGYIFRGMAPKERLAIRLMRECWDVSSQKVLDKDGHVSLQLRDVEFSLLTLGNRWLEGTPRTILEQVKEVRLIRENRLLSIVAPKHTADSILERVNRLLSNTRTYEFSTDLVSPKPLEPAVLEEVGRASKTVTRLDASGKKIVVTWIHMVKRNENFESAGDFVLRLLRDAYGPKPHASSELRIVSSDPTHAGRYFPVVKGNEQLPWHERSEKWERWTEALSQPDSIADAEELYIPKELLPLPLNSGPASIESEAAADASSGWSHDPTTATSVIFGHVVFAQQKQSSTPTTNAMLEPASQPDPSFSRTFIPTLPALSSLAFPNNLKETGLWHTVVVLHFAPSPDVPPELAASAPDLELRMDADHQEIKCLTSLRAIQNTFTGDVLFPAAPVDTRLVQQRYFSLAGNIIEHHVPSLLEFLSKSDMRPHHSKVVTPAHLPGVRLPRRLLVSTKAGNAVPSTTTPADAATIENTVSAMTDDAEPSTTTPVAADTDAEAPADPAEDTVSANVENAEPSTSTPADVYAAAEAEEPAEPSTTTPTSPPAAAEDTIQLDYTLAWVEIQRTVTASHEGFKMRYTNIQGGARGGERSELSVDAVHIDPPVEEEKQASASDRYEVVDEEDEGSIIAQLREPSFGKFDSHVMNTGKPPQPKPPTKPVAPEQFLWVVAGVVNETSDMRWQADH